MSYDLIRELCAWSDTPASEVKDPWAHIAAGEELMEEAGVALAKLLLKTTPQPIETAPKDGTYIFLWAEWRDDPLPDWEIGRWDVEEDRWSLPIKPPTHWLPLPEDPK